MAIDSTAAETRLLRRNPDQLLAEVPAVQHVQEGLGSRFQAVRNGFAIGDGAIGHHWRDFGDEVPKAVIVVRDNEPFNSQSLLKHRKHRC